MLAKQFSINLLFVVTGLSIRNCPTYSDRNVSGVVKESGLGDVSDLVLEDLDPRLRKKFEKYIRKKQEEIRIKTRDETWDLANTTHANATEYTKFQCAISSGRFSLERLNTEVELFLNHETSSTELQELQIDRQIEHTIATTAKRLSPSENQKSTIWRARNVFYYFWYSQSRAAVNFRTYFVKMRFTSDYTAYIAAAAQSQYYLYSCYAHPDRKSRLATPAIDAYLESRRNGLPVSLREILREFNNWPLLQVDLNCLNIVRRCLVPPEHDSINSLTISGVGSDRFVMPISGPEKGCSEFVKI